MTLNALTSNGVSIYFVYILQMSDMNWLYDQWLYYYNYEMCFASRLNMLLSWKKWISILISIIWVSTYDFKITNDLNKY